jgi:hypothetical protein
MRWVGTALLRHADLKWKIQTGRRYTGASPFLAAAITLLSSATTIFGAGITGFNDLLAALKAAVDKLLSFIR